jgi:phosphatidate phosphatase PAH1
MKLGDGGEAFFVFQTEGDIPEEMQTSPVVSPDQSPVMHPDNVLSTVFPLFLGRELMVSNRL